MLMSVAEISRNWGLKPRGVLHVGAHEGEEAGAYEDFGWAPVIWVEAQPQLVLKLRERLSFEKHKVLEAAVWDQDNITKIFKVSSNSQSSSLLDFGTHALTYPSIHVVKEFEISTKRLDGLLKDERVPNFINLDIQGVEEQALRGMGGLLKQVDIIYTEVNKKEVYLGCSQIESLDSFLDSEGFVRVAVRWMIGKGWGDALYLRKDSPHINSRNRLKSAKSALVFNVVYGYHFYNNQTKALIRKYILRNTRAN